MTCQHEHTSVVYNGLGAMRRWLFPQWCLVCGAAAEDRADLCGACEAGLPRVAPGCIRCAAPLPGAGFDRICGRCLTRPPYYDRTHALYRYDAPIDRLIQGFKYRRRLDWGRALAGALARELRAAGAHADAIVPIPLHRRRLRERGYNQSLELARPIGRLLDIPVLAHAARRVRPTPAQAGLSRDDRQRNVRNAFKIAQPSAVSEKRVAVVDDVMTSGHTVNALARALKHAGAGDVVVWVLARA